MLLLGYRIWQIFICYHHWYNWKEKLKIEQHASWHQREHLHNASSISNMASGSLGPWNSGPRWPTSPHAWSPMHLQHQLVEWDGDCQVTQKSGMVTVRSPKTGSPTSKRNDSLSSGMTSRYVYHGSRVPKPRSLAWYVLPSLEMDVWVLWVLIQTPTVSVEVWSCMWGM